MAPEIMKKGKSTPSSDMWGVGVISYALLAGHLPFEGDTPEMIKRLILKGEARYPPSWWRSVSALGVAFVKALLEQDADYI